MALYLTNEAAISALTQESTYYSDDQTPLTSEIFVGNKVFERINLGTGGSLHIGNSYNGEAVRRIHMALFIVLPEMILDPAIETKALSLRSSGNSFGSTFNSVTKELVTAFQLNTAELSETPVEDLGIVGRKTIKALDNALNRIGGYDAIEGGTIINYSLSEDVGYETVIYNIPNGQESISLYNRPLAQVQYEIVKLQKDDILKVLRKHNEQSASGWYHVVIIKVDRNIQTAEVQKKLDVAFKGHVSIEGHIQGQYIWKHWVEDGDISEPGFYLKAPMPDLYSKLFKVPAKPEGMDRLEFSNDVLESIIVGNYYTEKIIHKIGENGVADPSNGFITIPQRTYSEDLTDIKEDPFFQFCLNMLIYANNPFPQEPGARTIYPHESKEFFTKEAIETAQANFDQWLEDTQDAENLYENFATQVFLVDPKYSFVDSGDPVGQKIKVLLQENGQYYMWIPSRQCAESLWRIVDHVYTDAIPDDNFIVQLAENAVETLFPLRSVGGRLKLSAGLTYAILGADFEGDLSIWREDTNNPNIHILKISAFGEIKAGVDVSVEAGWGLYCGKKKNKRKKQGLGAAIGISAQLMSEYNVLVEFEIPITGGDPLSQSVAAVLYGGAGMILGGIVGSAIALAIGNFDLDFWNYMTKLKCYKGKTLQVSGGAEAGFRFGKQEDVDDWTEPSGTKKSSFVATKLAALLAAVAIEGGADVGLDYGKGFDIDIKYYNGPGQSNYITDDGFRMPIKIDVYAFGEGSIHSSFLIALSTKLFGLSIGPLMEEGLGVRIGYTFDILDYLNISSNPFSLSDNEISAVRDFNTGGDAIFQVFLAHSKKNVGLYNYSGDLDRYLELGYEVRYNFELNEEIQKLLDLVNSNYNSVVNWEWPFVVTGTQLESLLLEVIKTLKYVKFKKRFNIGFGSRFYKNILRQKRMSRLNRIGYKIDLFKQNDGFGGNNYQVYGDLNYAVTGEEYIKGVKAFYYLNRINVAVVKAELTDDIVRVNHLENMMKSLVKRTDIDIVEQIDCIVYFFEGPSEDAPGVGDNCLQISDTDIEAMSLSMDDLSKVLKALVWNTIFQGLGSKNPGYNVTDIVETVFSEDLRKFYKKMIYNYVDHWEEIDLSMHVEEGFVVGGFIKAGEGLKIRLFLGLEASVIFHSDLIKDDVYFPQSVWHEYISELFEINPTTDSIVGGPVVITSGDKAALLDVMFDKFV